MTLENITTEAINRIEQSLNQAIGNLCQVRSDAAKGDITIKEAADRINRIGEEIEKAIYPENHE